MSRVYNFSAGPAVLPLPVLEKAKAELVNTNGSGMSIMEMSHRSNMFLDIINESEKLLRELMSIPDNYKVLFLQGGASTQFAMVPLNLLSGSKKADFVNTGVWSKKAISEARKYGEVNVVASSEDTTFNYIPKLDESKFSKDADYFHITLNNTIYGTRYTVLPDTGDVPLVTDASSNILSQVYPVSKFGLIYAGAQKNLIGKAMDFTPTMLDYKIHANSDSMYNTPPTFAIYMAMLVFQWLKEMGGISEMEKRNIEKAGLLYDFLDNSNLFKGTVVPKDRSLMNVPFLLPSDELNKQFIQEAKAAGLVNLAGHRSVGGMRASIYNPMPLEGVKSLVDFMEKFELKNK